MSGLRALGPSPPLMSSDTLEQLIESLQNNPEKDQIGLELQALQSIYEDGAISVWKLNHVESQHLRDMIRLEVRTALFPPHESIPFKILVSIPSAYPASAPPQLQLLSRYIGSFQVDSALFGSVLKTYIASGRIEFVPDQVAIFDGIENVREIVMRWYEDRLKKDAAAELRREDEKHIHTEDPQSDTPLENSDIIEFTIDTTQNPPPQLPEGVHIWVSEPIVDRKSTFIGRACQITHPSQVQQILSFLMEDKSISRATHPIINAWRCEINGILHQDNDDDGETAAGGRLAHLLHILDLKDVLVVVTRYFGGIHLHNDRFKHINAVARAALEEGGFLDAPDDPKRAGRVDAGSKGKRKP